MKKLLFPVFSLIMIESYSQSSEHLHTSTCGEDYHHYELGVPNSAVYFLNEKYFSYGLHLHVVKNIKYSKYGYALGYERIIDEHCHNSFGIVGVYRPIHEWRINLSPGIIYED